MTERTATRRIAASALLLALAGGTGLTAAAQEDPVTLRPDDPAEVALGARVYAENCASCHGAELEGEPDWRTRNADGTMPAPPHDETGHTWHHDDATLFRLTKEGINALLGEGSEVASGMPVFEGVLTDEEIRASLSYIKSTWPGEVRAIHDDINAR